MGKEYVTAQELYCVEHNGIYPQDIQKAKNEYLTFGTFWLTYTKITQKGQRTKHINGYRCMTATEINRTLDQCEWEEADDSLQRTMR